MIIEFALRTSTKIIKVTLEFVDLSVKVFLIIRTDITVVLLGQVNV
jgi:hypothetical protein